MRFNEILKETSFKDLGNWPLVSRLFASLFVVFLVVVIGYLFFVGPAYTALRQSKTEEHQLMERWTRLLDKAAAIPRNQQQIVEMKQTFSDVLKRMPAYLNIAKLVDDISRLGANNNVHFKLLKPLPEKRKEFYVEMPVEIVVTGNYHQLASFVNQLANLEQFMTFPQFSVQPEDENKPLQTVDNEKLKMKLRVIIYHGIKEKEK